MSLSPQIRNICIIAHVDHGKTTLVDHLLRQAGTFRKHQSLQDRVMDSMDLERERGITILSKNTAIRLGDTKVNIVDTPGHADFGGEVERILGMVDGALLLVDAAEGPLPQTRFVLEKALAQGMRVILVINKVDRKECQAGNRIQEVVNQTFDLFDELGATEDQLDFPIVYACARDGWCTLKDDEIPGLLDGSTQGSLTPLFQLVLEHIPAPQIETGSFRMRIMNLGYSDYVGRLAIGRVVSGTATKQQKLFRLGKEAKTEPFSVSRIEVFEGLQQVEVDQIQAGEIGIVAGLESFEIGDTLVEKEEQSALPRIEVEKPTLSMVFTINTSPLSGQSGEAIQSRKLRDRLLREVRANVALRFEETDALDQFRVLGRGELQFAILIEQMRREGLEFGVGKPSVLYKEENGTKMEPLERVVLDLPEDHVGDVMQLFQKRKGVVKKYEPFLSGHASAASTRVRLEIDIPTRGLLGLRSRFMNITRGNGLMSSYFHSYVPHMGQILHRINGALVADRPGKAVEYALLNLEDRGVLFVKPGDPVYEGMIVGENTQENDMNVNPCKEKKLTNVRAVAAEILVHLKGIRQMSLEQSIEWIDSDEWIEITPESIRLRKKVLPANKRNVRRADHLGL